MNTVSLPAARQSVLAGSAGICERVWFRFFEAVAKALGGATLLTATATLNFGLTAAQTSADLTIALTNAIPGGAVSVAPPKAPDANSCFTAWVSALNVVTVRFNNYSAGPIDPASGDYTVWVMQ